MVNLIQQRSLTAGKMALGVSALLAVLLVNDSDRGEGANEVTVHYLFWFLHAFFGVLLLRGITGTLQELQLGRLTLRQIQLLGASLGTVVFTPIALILELSFSGLGMIERGNATAMDLLSLGALVEEWSHLAGPFIASSMLLSFTFPGLLGPDLAQPPTATEPSSDVVESTGNGLFELLPAALDSDVQWMRSDLNYLHVHTQSGQAMVLYSLRSAARELSCKGLLVHRSYWVAQDAVARVRRSSKGMVVVLHDGEELPVSRRRQKEVVERFGANYRRHS